MNKLHLIYIIIVNYNGWNDTLQCIESLNQIDYNNYKVVVVDNDSQESYDKIMMEKYPDVIFIQAGENLGFAGGNNIGIDRALSDNADYVLLLNNDTIVDPEFLSNIIEKVKEEKNIGIATGKIYYHDNKNILWYAGGRFSNLKGNAYHFGTDEVDRGQFDVDKEVTFISGCYMLIPKEVIKTVGNLSEEYFLYHEDVDYCLKVAKKGYKLMYYPNSIIYHKVSASTGKKSKMYEYYYNRNRCILIDKNLRFPYKHISFMFFYLTRIFKLFFGEQRNSIVWRALGDYKKRRWGYQKI
ncbi:glycosyltransferase family 2 protein [Clostridium polynesiense]|uniref:glycosyltransferase family 2 protein n=1 Tax=Clostridium polynesiense TaxID=1325933 RepID=UPI00058B345D|nr:glycosyltransferase family 2 protein [Clostridium polynesiense]